MGVQGLEFKVWVLVLRVKDGHDCSDLTLRFGFGEEWRLLGT